MNTIEKRVKALEEKIGQYTVYYRFLFGSNNCEHFEHCKKMSRNTPSIEIPEGVKVVYRCDPRRVKDPCKGCTEFKKREK